MAIISRNLISRKSKNREIRENLAPRKFPSIRYDKCVIIKTKKECTNHRTKTHSYLYCTVTRTAICHYTSLVTLLKREKEREYVEAGDSLHVHVCSRGESACVNREERERERMKRQGIVYMYIYRREECVCKQG